jgi:hypothetical protein
MRASEKRERCRITGFPFSRSNQPLIPAPEPPLKKTFAGEMNSLTLAEHCIAKEAVWKVLRSVIV